MPQGLYGAKKLHVVGRHRAEPTFKVVLHPYIPYMYTSDNFTPCDMYKVGIKVSTP